MTEADWTSCTDPQIMLGFLEAGVMPSPRKLRLFAAACCRRRLTSSESNMAREAIVAVERLADGEATFAEMVDACKATRCRNAAPSEDPWVYAGEEEASEAAAMAADEAVLLAGETAYQRAFGQADGDRKGELRFAKAVGEEQQAQAAILRDILGPLPFHPVKIEPSWRTANVLALAGVIYDERRFDEMCVLADTLEASGCDNKEIIQHLRQQEQVHVRGCWFLDLVLGRE